MKHKVAVNESYGGFSLSNKAIKWLNEKYGIEYQKSNFTKELYLLEHLERHDKRLIECIEALGEKASREYSRICVVEIDSDEYFIEDYDGMESVITPDNLKWIKIKEE